jgi:hypothetical protein
MSAGFYRVIDPLENFKIRVSVREVIFRNVLVNCSLKFYSIFHFPLPPFFSLNKRYREYQVPLKMLPMLLSISILNYHGRRKYMVHSKLQTTLGIKKTKMASGRHLKEKVEESYY